MAIAGIDDGRSRKMTACSRSHESNRWGRASIGSTALCIVCIVCATTTHAVDTSQAVPEASQAASYERKVSNEAADFVPEGVAEERADHPSPRAAATPGSLPQGVAPERVDRIKAAVNQAFAGLQTDQVSEQVHTPQAPNPDIDPIDARRQALRALVVAPSEPASEQESGYLDQLRDEVAHTVVFREAVVSEPESLPAGSRIVADAGPGTYRVQPGDSLWKIAQAKFGDGYKWRRIYETNREKLRKVDVLRIGQVLLIPDR